MLLLLLLLLLLDSAFLIFLLLTRFSRSEVQNLELPSYIKHNVMRSLARDFATVVAGVAAWQSKHCRFRFENDGEIRRQPGGGRVRADTADTEREREDRPVAVPPSASVSNENRCPFSLRMRRLPPKTDLCI